MPTAGDIKAPSKYHVEFDMSNSAAESPGEPLTQKELREELHLALAESRRAIMLEVREELHTFAEKLRSAPTHRPNKRCTSAPPTNNSRAEADGYTSGAETPRSFGENDTSHKAGDSAAFNYAGGPFGGHSLMNRNFHGYLASSAAEAYRDSHSISSHDQTSTSRRGHTSIVSNTSVFTDFTLESASSPRAKQTSCVGAFLASPAFHIGMSIVLLLNAAWIGFLVEYNVTHPERGGDAIPIEYLMVNLLFCAVFVCEMSLRLSDHGLRNFFFGPGCAWNLFDALVTLSMLADEALSVIALSGVRSSSRSLDNVGFIRIVRVLRLARVVRLVRILRLVRELQRMVVAIFAAIRSFAWALVLIAMIVYIASVHITQLVADHFANEAVTPTNAEDIKLLTNFYGSVGRSALSLYEAVSGGVDWDGLIQPLIRAFGSSWIPFFFCLYIAFILLVLMNVVTGLFVDVAQATAKADKGMELVQMLRELFQGRATITWDEFSEHIGNPLLEEYFKAIDLHPSEGRGLFNLIDFDNSGTLFAEDFVLSCLRLTGPAKALDLALLMKEQCHMNRWCYQSLQSVEAEFQDLARNVDELSQLLKGKLDMLGRDLPRSKNTPTTPRAGSMPTLIPIAAGGQRSSEALNSPQRRRTTDSNLSSARPPTLTEMAFPPMCVPEQT